MFVLIILNLNIYIRVRREKNKRKKPPTIHHLRSKILVRWEISLMTIEARLQRCRG
uniref:Uncharacterized protein n=1 Tax=Octopus bimaculoides TaxID=37653 RepID=A0A0L8FV30_OCTBM